MIVQPVTPTPPRRPLRRFLLIGGVAIAFLLMLGIGILLGSSIRSAQAAGITDRGFGILASGTETPDGQAGSDCKHLTVTSVNGQTIVAKAADGTSVTINTTSSTTYTANDTTVTASAVVVGTQISVNGTTKSDGSIAATAIQIDND